MAPAVTLRPPLADASDDTWSAITTGDALYQHFLADDGTSWPTTDPNDWFDDQFDDPGRPGPPATLPAVVRWWKKAYVDHLRADRSAAREHALVRWRALGEMLWCFDQARREHLPPNAMDRATIGQRLPVFDGDGVRRFEGGSTPRHRSRAVVNAYMCIRSFRAEGCFSAASGSGSHAAPVYPSAKVAVPVALYDPTQRRGVVATLEVDLMPGGIGEVAAHPCAAFDTLFHEVFDASMRISWQLARGTVSTPLPHDGRWRLRWSAPLGDAAPQGPEILNELKEVEGPSASGAAARAWWHALHGKVPDAEVVVLAQVLDDGRTLGPVDRTPEKVRAIIDAATTVNTSHAFDTIVVVGDKQAQEASKALGDNPFGLRVIALDD